MAVTPPAPGPPRTSHSLGPPDPLGPPAALWVVPVSDLGGVARHVRDVTARGIPGWRVVLLCPPGPLADLLRDQGTAVLTGPLGPHAGLRASVRTLRRTVSALRPAVVHTHLSYADITAAVAGVASRSAHVSTEHGISGDPGMYHAHRGEAAVMAAAHATRLRRLSALVAVSEATAQTVRDRWRPPARLPLVVIHNGVDRPQNPQPRRGGGLQVLSLARLAPEKGLDHLLRAFARVRAERPDARLVLAGEGPLRAHLGRLAADLDLTGSVDLPGHIDPVTALAHSDVLVQLSTWENASYSLLDAVAAGLGVVATPVGGNPEILPPRCLVAADDSGAVAAEILRQGTDRPARPRLPEGWPTMADMVAALASVYASVRADGDAARSPRERP